MTRTPFVLLAASGVLFVAGVAAGSNVVVLLSFVTAAAMLVSLARLGTAEVAAKDAPLVEHAAPVDAEPMPVVVIDLAALEAKKSAPASRAKAAPKKAAPKKAAPKKVASEAKPAARKTAPQKAAATAVLEDVSLDELLARVQGLGPRRVDALVEAFGTTSALRAAGKDGLVAIPGVGPAIADRVLAELS